jgi:hypothetical protein
MISSYVTSGDQENLSIEYKNIYSINGDLYYLTTKDVLLPYVNKFTNQYPFRPYIKQFETENQLNSYLNTFENKEEIELAALGDNIWYGNIGHALWDGLYPLYVALVKFGYINDDFTPLFGDFQNKQTLAYHPTIQFAGKDILDYHRLDKDKLIHFKTLIAGTGNTGNRVINPNYTLYGESEYNALSLFKKRLLSRYNLEADKPLNTPLKAIIVKNKRFSQKEINVIDNIVNYYKDKIEIKYIDWYHDYSSFEDQIKEVIETDIHITGPGTGMMYMPFLKKGAININLGYMEHIQTNTARPNLKIDNINNDSLIIPGWMEQSVCAAANYVNTLYYDRFTYNDMEFEPLIQLINNGIKQVGNLQENNWNIDALIFKEYCRRCNNPKELCHYLTEIAFFIELFVNEHPKTLNGCPVDINLLKQIKKEFNFNEKYEIKI